MAVAVRVPIPCHHCGAMENIAPVNVGRPHRCQHCGGTFPAVMRQQHAKPDLDLRSLTIICAVVREPFTAVFRRERPDPVYRIYRSERCTGTLFRAEDEAEAAGAIIARETVRDRFAAGSLDWSRLTCKWCGVSGIAQCAGHAEQHLFCKSGIVTTSHGDYATCPVCANAGYVGGAIETLDGQAAVFEQPARSFPQATTQRAIAAPVTHRPASHPAADTAAGRFAGTLQRLRLLGSGNG